jgi:hypothetical protein
MNMKIKTSELTGAALDWAVAKCQGMLEEPWLWGDTDEVLRRYKFSTNWAQGGSIIEREKIEVFIEDECWKAYSSNSLPQNFNGDTPLIAAMRCYVASKLGDEIEVPDELKEAV